METITYNIPSIHCGHCVHTIKMELGDLEGVRSVDGDLDTQQVTVTFEQPATKEKIEALLKEIHYPPEN